MEKNVINTLYTVQERPPLKVDIGYHETGKFNTLASLDNQLGKMSHILFRQLYRKTAMAIARATKEHIYVVERDQGGYFLRNIGECLNPYDDDGDNDGTDATTS